MTLENEKEIVRKAKKNSREFAKLYTYYYPKIRVYIANKVNGESLAEDLTSQVFEKALKSIDSFKWQGISFGSWLYRIARNSVYDYYRSARRRKTSQLSEDAESSIRESVLLEEKVLHDERELYLYELIARLSKKDQYLIYYRYFEGMSIKQVAEEVELSEANVATRLHRIREKLKKLDVLVTQ